MEFINKIETTAAGWAKNLPHLPVSAQKWLSANVWWIALIGAILTLLTTFIWLILLLIGGFAASYIFVIDPYHQTVVNISSFVSLAFAAAQGLILALAVKPLQAQKRQGWDLLFFALLLHGVAIAVGVIFSIVLIDFLGVFGGVVFGALGLAVGAYFLFEIHGQFAHVRTTKTAKTAKKA
ncbi:MAG: hypothetical protein JWM52_177 [Candidatus Saccharibacteria bacterium]|nr:hypothetical protein [Candidatus Saccharibacteria bacterium]